MEEWAHLISLHTARRKRKLPHRPQLTHPPSSSPHTGHTFCRQCLKAAAERQMSSCALCRKSHTLDPDVLRAQFHQQRFANLSWRLGKTRATRAFSKPSWEVLFNQGGGGGGGGGGKCEASCGGAGGRSTTPCSGWESTEEEVVKKGGAADGETKKYVGPDIGALPRRLLMRRAAKSVKRAFITQDPDVGGCSAAALRNRWTALMQPGKAVLPEEVGGEANVAGGMKRRWSLLMQGAAAVLPGDAGALPVAALAAQWQGVAMHLAEKSGGVVGSMDQARVAAAWAQVEECAAAGMDVGALPRGVLEAALRHLVSSAKDCGVASLVELGARFSKEEVGEDVGALATQALAARLTALLLTELGDVGGLPTAHLAQAWQGLVQGGGGDVGAASVEVLSARWVGGGRYLTADAGACDAATLRARWTGAFLQKV